MKGVFIMQTQTNKNYKTMVQLLHLGVNIIWIFSITLFVIGVSALIFGLIISHDFLSFSVDNFAGYLQTNISQSVQLSFPIEGGDVTLKTLAWSGGLTLMAYSALSIVVTYYFKKIMDQLLKGHPFNEICYRALRINGFIFMAATVFIPIFEFIFFSQMVNVITTPEINLNFSLNLNYLWIGMILYILAKIFEYGNTLQTSYDETV